MKTFTDSTGRAWTVTINVDAMKRVKSLIGVDLMQALEGSLLERLSQEPVLLCDTVYAICKPQADAQKITDEDFGRAMAGDAIEQATCALLEELVSFFPSRRRPLLQKALTKMRSLEQMVLTAAERRLESGEIEKLMEAELQKQLGEPSGSSPASSAANPAP